MTNLIKRWVDAYKDRPKVPAFRCFDEAQKAEQAYDPIDRGTRNIPIAQITGSVGRYHDFDDKFRLKQHVPNDRLQNIVQAMLEGKSLPPVKVYKIKDEYYVLDGHHRIAASRRLKRDYINACIVELLPSKNTLENILYREKTAFRDRTGLEAPIELTEVGQYAQMALQIEAHQEHLQTTGGKEVPFHAAAADWHETIHGPLCEIIKRGGLLTYFPKRTLDDLYMYISFHQWEKRQSRRYGIGIDRLIPTDMEAFREKMRSKKEADYPEMKRQITAFVLMTVVGKHEHRIIERLFETEGVQEVHSVHGNIDLLVKIALTRDLLASDAELVSQFVHENVRQLPGVKSTQTLIPGFSRIKAEKAD